MTFPVITGIYLGRKRPHAEVIDNSCHGYLYCHGHDTGLRFCNRTYICKGVFNASNPKVPDLDILQNLDSTLNTTAQNLIFNAEVCYLATRLILD